MSLSLSINSSLLSHINLFMSTFMSSAFFSLFHASLISSASPGRTSKINPNRPWPSCLFFTLLIMLRVYKKNSSEKEKNPTPFSSFWILLQKFLCLHGYTLTVTMTFWKLHLKNNIWQWKTEFRQRLPTEDPNTFSKCADNSTDTIAHYQKPFYIYTLPLHCSTIAL